LPGLRKSAACVSARLRRAISVYTRPRARRRAECQHRAACHARSAECGSREPVRSHREGRERSTDRRCRGVYPALHGGDADHEHAGDAERDQAVIGWRRGLSRQRSSDDGGPLGRDGHGHAWRAAARHEATPGGGAMINRIIDWCAANRFLVFVGVACLTGWGIWAMTNTPLDAVPDISDVQVIVSAEWTGRSPDLIEDQVTYPIVTALVSTPHVKAVRGFTDFGISYVYVIFQDGTDMYWARSRVVEYLQGLRHQLPEGVNPTIGPDATGVGWVFEYALVDDTGQHTLAELRIFQD